MAYLGTEGLTKLLKNSNVISPFDEKKIKNSAYELSLGGEVFQTGSTTGKVEILNETNKQVFLSPGQFALLLTAEEVNIPKDKIAFISIKASIKLKGLVNVSGFHVDPGFKGKLVFSVYNAGPATIVLEKDQPCFPLWIASLNEESSYKGEHENQKSIPAKYLEALKAGELASPSALSKRIDEVKSLKVSNDWFLKTIIGLAIAISLKLFWDWNEYNIGFKRGYDKKENELVTDSISKRNENEFNALRTEIDSLKHPKMESPKPKVQLTK
jgi:dCTP deaminase